MCKEPRGRGLFHCVCTLMTDRSQGVVLLSVAVVTRCDGHPPLFAPRPTTNPYGQNRRGKDHHTPPPLSSSSLATVTASVPNSMMPSNGAHAATPMGHGYTHANAHHHISLPYADAYGASNGSGGGSIGGQHYNNGNQAAMMGHASSSYLPTPSASTDSVSSRTLLPSMPPQSGATAHGGQAAKRQTNKAKPTSKKRFNTRPSTEAPPIKAARTAQVSTPSAAKAGHDGTSMTNGKRKMMPMSAFKAVNGDAGLSAASAKKKADAEKFKRNSRACTYCQRLKMKCSGPTADGPCERCRRTGRECMVQERAPRRPWTKKKDMQIQQLTDRLEEMESMLRNVFNGNVDETATHAAAQLDVISKAKRSILDGTNTSLSSVSDEEQSVPPSNAKPAAPTAAAGGQPYLQELAGHPAVQQSSQVDPNSFNTIGPSPSTINNWLTLTNAPTTPSAAFELDLAYVDAHREQLPFVSTGKVSPGEAVDMFHLFMTSCVMHTAVLDPEWHTISRVGDSSPFLFAVTIFIASTYHRERRNLPKELQEEMNVLIGKTITSGSKSVEVVQGFLLLYQWNSPSADPAHDRAWLLAGVGIRLATELQLHKTQIRRSVDAGTACKLRAAETDRERINRERCWLMTFLVDRSLSIAVGRSWTISEKADLVRDSDKWHSQPASRIWDQGISAFADLLKTTSRQADVLHTTIAKWDDPTSENEEFDCDTMMRIMNDELEHWRGRWLSKDFYARIVGLDKEMAEAAVTKRNRSSSSATNGVHQGTGEQRGSAANAGDDASSNSSATVNTEVLDVHTRTFYYITKQASFRFNFAVLVLNSFGLQYCAARPKLIHARTYCVTHAIRAAQGLIKAARDGLGATMTYAPQTQFTILSFGIISLLKLSSLVDEVVGERLIEQVQTCVTFLESISIASDHTPARLASLVRTMLRRRDQRKSLRAYRNSTRSGQGEVDDSQSILGPTQANQAAAVDKAGSDDSDAEDAEDGRPAFAPGMEVHKLPQRSSRAVTPEGHHNLTLGTTEGQDLLQQSMSSLDQAAPPPQDNNAALQSDPLRTHTFTPHESHLGVDNDASLWNLDHRAGDDLMSGLPNFDADVESTLQSLGFMANIGTAGWSQMTADEILDDSFWLRLPNRAG